MCAGVSPIASASIVFDPFLRGCNSSNPVKKEIKTNQSSNGGHKDHMESKYCKLGQKHNPIFLALKFVTRIVSLDLRCCLWDLDRYHVMYVCVCSWNKKLFTSGRNSSFTSIKLVCSHTFFEN